MVRRLTGLLAAELRISSRMELAPNHTSDKRYADRLKALYLLGGGWQVSQVAQALMIDRERVRNHHKRYRKVV